MISRNITNVIVRKVIFLENIGILILFRMQPIRFRYIEPFSRNYNLKKSEKKNLTSNISEIYGSILWRKELSQLVYKIYPYKKFQSD